MGSDRLYAYGFRVYFTPLFTVLFTFPSRYWFTIGLSGVFSLGGWSRRIHTGFHVPRTTQGIAITIISCLYRTVTFCGLYFHIVPVKYDSKCRDPTTPILP